MPFCFTERTMTNIFSIRFSMTFNFPVELTIR